MFTESIFVNLGDPVFHSHEVSSREPKGAMMNRWKSDHAILPMKRVMIAEGKGVTVKKECK